MTMRQIANSTLLIDDTTGKLGHVNPTTGNVETISSLDPTGNTGVGAYLSSVVAVGSAVSLTTATPANVTSLALPAGDWDVEGLIDFALTGATTTDWAAGLSATSATFGSQDQTVSQPVVLTTHTDTYQLRTPSVRFNLAAPATVYMVAQGTFSAGSEAVYGTLQARRRA